MSESNGARPLPELPRNPLFDVEPPQSVNAEKALLGSVLINPDAFVAIAVFLKPDDFFFLRHSHIWALMGRLHAQDIPIDPELLADELETQKNDDQTLLQLIGGRAYIAELTNSTPTSVHAEFYAHFVFRAAVRRRILVLADRMKALAVDEAKDLDAIVARIIAEVMPLSELARIDPKGLYLDDGVQRVLDRVEAAIESRARGGDAQVVTTGLPDLDYMLGGGIVRGKVCVLGGRSHHGKTAALINMALAAARSGMRVAYFSTETPRDDVILQMVAIEAGLQSIKLVKGALTQFEQSEMYAAAERIQALPMQVFEAVDITCKELNMYCELMQFEYGLDLIVVDYVQDVFVPHSAFKGEKAAEVGYVAETLSKIATDLKVAMLQAAQVSRVVDNRRDKRAHKGDLEWSNMIEKKADVVVMLFLHGAAFPDADDPTHLEFTVEKNRQTGKFGTVDQRLNAMNQRVEPYTQRVVIDAYDADHWTDR